ncbi:MAG: VWA domain-containing protein [Deltaproteobacteria bacterium]|nr:VWA domain-containing protein [Deltaproteobacteria bacterium]
MDNPLKKDGHFPENNPKKSKAWGPFRKDLKQSSLVNRCEPISEEELNALIANIVQQIRSHPGIARGPSVRGTIAFKDVLQGFKEIQGGLTGVSIEKAALVTLPHRVGLNQGYTGFPKDIVIGIVKEVLYGIRFSKEQAFATLGDEEDCPPTEDVISPLQNVPFSEMSNMQRRQSMEKSGVDVISDEDERWEPLESSTQTGLSHERNKKRFSLTAENIGRMCEELEQKRISGEWTEGKYEQEKNKFEEMLSAASLLQSGVLDQEMSETVMEFMDAKDKKWSQDITFRDMYIYYSIKGNEKNLMPPKRGYYGLRVLVDEMERRGIIECATIDKGHALTSYALDILLEHVIPGVPKGRKLNSIIGYGMKHQDQHEHGVQRYASSDVFRNISTRHTLREIIRKRKSPANIDKSDIRVFIKKGCRRQSDIVFCVDTSGSMGFYRKLTYARLITAGMARAALGKGDKVGIISFKDLGSTILPLTDKKKDVFNYIVGLSAWGSTNIGDGISCSTELLLREFGQNKKYIVLITDGRSSAVSEKVLDQMDQSRGKDLTEEAAILETRIASSRGVITSVVHITDGEESDVEFVNKIADIGKGRVLTVSSLTDIKDFLQ